jgi:hypothetical protein
MGERTFFDYTSKKEKRFKTEGAEEEHRGHENGEARMGSGD